MIKIVDGEMQKNIEVMVWVIMTSKKFGKENNVDEVEALNLN